MIVAPLPFDGPIAATGLRYFDGRQEDRTVEIRRVGTLVNAWLMAQDRPEANPKVVLRIERKLHSLIKSSSLFGLVLSFAGLNLWVDDRTPDGVVERQESINL